MDTGVVTFLAGGAFSLLIAALTQWWNRGTMREQADRTQQTQLLLADKAQETQLLLAREAADRTQQTQILLWREAGRRDRRAKRVEELEAMATVLSGHMLDSLFNAAWGTQEATKSALDRAANGPEHILLLSRIASIPDPKVRSALAGLQKLVAVADPIARRIFQERLRRGDPDDFPLSELPEELQAAENDTRDLLLQAVMTLNTEVERYLYGELPRDQK